MLNNSLASNKEKLQQVAAETGADYRDIKLQQAVAEMELPAAFGYVPWGHHIEIITKCNSVEEALFYIQRTIEEGWSRTAGRIDHARMDE